MYNVKKNISQNLEALKYFKIRAFYVEKKCLIKYKNHMVFVTV